MNVFKGRKKSQDGGDQSARPSMESDVPPLPAVSSRGRTFRRNKKSKPDPKPEPSLSLALPSTDDFRTSLLMPNLSARFSMLREQDDPNSKLGKANDDSVLFPKRASRLNLFGHDNLSDIDEVSTMAGSIRPPFAYGRSNSYASADGMFGDDDSREGSVMGRSRPVEGNKFFAGRQKVFLIPVGTGDGAQNGDGTRRGRAIYEDDIALSTFQVYKENEKSINSQERYSEEEDRQESPIDNNRSSSPSHSEYNRNRETSSSTTSGPPNRRTSTAATSTTSQSASPLHGISTQHGPPYGPAPSTPSGKSAALERGGSKTQRLYSQGLNQQTHEQQTSSMHRIESMQRQRVNGGFPRTVSKTRSATNLNDKFQRPANLYTSSFFRSESPQPSMTPPDLGGFDLGLQPQTSVPRSRDEEPAFGRSPPLSPPMSPGPEESPASSTFIHALEPNDLGKATASATFSKPSAPYDDNRYAERQKQMQTEREEASSRAAIPPDGLHGWTGLSRFDTTETKDEEDVSQVEPPQQVKHIAPTPSTNSLLPPSSRSIKNRFLPNDSYLSEDNDSEVERSPQVPSFLQSKQRVLSHQNSHESPSTKYEHDDQHPAFQTHSFMLDPEPEPEDEPSSYPAIVSRSRAQSNAKPSTVREVESPTLGPENGLNGLIRAHLRTDSEQSSIYPLPSPNRIPTEFVENQIPLQADKFQTRTGTSFANPWQNRQSPQQTVEEPSPTVEVPAKPVPVPVPVSFSARTRQILDHAAANRNKQSKARQVLGDLAGLDKAQQILGDEPPQRGRGSSDGSWQEQAQIHHIRGASTETQKEREDFANELADRRRQVQDNLKSIADIDSRAGSPMPGRGGDASSTRTGGPLGLLKKASRTSLVGKTSDTPSKALKMLGVTSGAMSMVDLPRRNHHENSHPMAVEHGVALGSPQYQRMGPPSVRPPTAPRPSPQSSQSRDPSREDNGRRQNFSKRRPSSPPRPVYRDRAGSEQPHRPFHSNADRPRIQERAMTAMQKDTYPFPTTEPPRRVSPPRARPVIEQSKSFEPPRSRSAMSNRFTGNSKSAYIDTRNLAPLQVPYAQNYPTPVRSPRASPMPPSPNPMQPPHSATYYTSTHYEPSLTFSNSSPNLVPNGSQPMAPRVQIMAPRKRSISKHEISEPTFMSTTSTLPTFSIHHQQGGISPSGALAPPIPPINPRRRKGTGPTQNIFTAFGPNGQYAGDRRPGQYASPSVSPLPRSATSAEMYEEHSTFSADESDSKEKMKPMRYKLRKSSSEGGNLAAKARAYANNAPSPALPGQRTIAGMF
ncbi:hypothetical protein MMC25_000256 [Agyrium rufum]|nr:hypothetical protein [Agyrium rufum]